MRDRPCLQFAGGRLSIILLPRSELGQRISKIPRAFFLVRDRGRIADSEIF